jgi:mRNA-degrading endonuclease RelE of RelBE toxin-antitoxin system
MTVAAQFLIADTFTDSLAKLTGDEQKAVKTTAFELQMNPAHPSMHFERVDKAKDKNFWSARVSRDLRLIVHKTGGSLILCYVAHHDPAYQWAERRKLEVHPTTGAAQLIEIRETVKEIAIPKYVEVEQSARAKPPLFANISDEELLGYGVPIDWLKDVRIANEDSLLALADHLPGEAAEALLDLATGVKPKVRHPVPTIVDDPFAHPDARRRFRVMNNVEELERALEYPWEKWSVFLHPTQRELVKGDYSGPVRVSGSAGTGKTIVALHRSVHLARTHPDARVLLTTFSDTLANALRTKLRRLISNEPRLGERIEVHSLNAIGRRLYQLNVVKPQLASRDVTRAILKEAAGKVEGHNFGIRFLLSEWEQVVDAWQLENWEAYRDVTRLGKPGSRKNSGRCSGPSSIKCAPILRLAILSPMPRCLRVWPPILSRASICFSTLPWWTRLRISTHLNCGFSPRWAEVDATACSLLVTWANGFFRKHFLGSR